MVFREEVYTSFLKVMYKTSILIFLLNTVSHIIIARILLPEDFGKLAMILATEGILLMVVDLGISTRIIQKHNITSDHLSKYYNYSIVTGLFIALLLSLIVIFLEGLSSLWIFCGSLLFIDAILVVPVARTRKKLLFKELSNGYLVSTIISTSFTLLTIFFWQDIKVVIIGLIVNKLVLFIYLRLKDKGLEISLNLQSFGQVVFSDLKEIKYIFGNQFFNVLSARVDDLVIGKVFGSGVLGFYSISWNLMALPLVRINSVLNEVSFPYYIGIKNAKSKFLHYLDNLLFGLLIGVPILLLLVLNAEELVLIVYGDKWAGVVPILKILGLVGISKLINNPGGGFLLSLNKNRELMYWSLGWLIAIALIFAGLSFSGFELGFILKVFLIVSFLSVIVFKSIILQSSKEARVPDYLLHILLLGCSFALYFTLEELRYSSNSLLMGVFVNSTFFMLGYGLLVFILNKKFKFLSI